MPVGSVGSTLTTDMQTALIEQTQIQLDQENCAAAYQTLYPYYNSSSSTSALRLQMASVYGCYAGVKFFSLIASLVTHASALSSAGLWAYLAVSFPSVASPDDRIPLSSAYSIDALIATLKPGTLLVPAISANTTSFNPGSLLFEDRARDANSYLLLMSMSLMGSLLSRNGVNHQLPSSWTAASGMKGDPCALVSGVMHFYDSLQALQQNSTGKFSEAFGQLEVYLGAGLDLACALGCQSVLGCNNSVTCSQCPVTLRDRTSCTGLDTDVNSCAGAGLIHFLINPSWL